MTLISNHVLIPHAAEWSRPPELRRLWRSGVDASLDGAEDRASVRGEPWLELAYILQPWNNTERAKLEPRLRAALKSGRVAVPHFGEGSKLAATATAGATTLTLDRTTHGLVQYQWLFLQSDNIANFDTWEVCLISNVSGATITLSPALTCTHTLNEWVRPLLFGRLGTEQFGLRNRQQGQFPIRVQFQGRAVLGWPYDPFEEYAAGAAGTLGSGEAFSAAWILGDGDAPPWGKGYDTMESYSVGAVSTPLQGGTAWDDQWFIDATTPPDPVSVYDDLESYDAGAISTPLTSGYGWATDWAIGDNLFVEP